MSFCVSLPPWAAQPTSIHSLLPPRSPVHGSHSAGGGGGPCELSAFTGAAPLRDQECSELELDHLGANSSVARYSQPDVRPADLAQPRFPYVLPGYLTGNGSHRKAAVSRPRDEAPTAASALPARGCRPRSVALPPLSPVLGMLLLFGPERVDTAQCCAFPECPL